MILPLVLICLVPITFCQTAVKTFYIRKDYFNGVKPGEFTVFDPTGEIKHFRIESHFGFMHSLSLVSYPSQSVVGRLKSKVKFVLYESEISIFDSKSQTWINGTISQHFKLLESRFTIQWNDRRLMMVSDAFSLTTRFYEEDQPNIILAQFKKRILSAVFVNKFDMDIFVNDIPDGVFLFGLAVKDLLRRTKGKN